MAITGTDLVAPVGALADSLLAAVGAARPVPVPGAGVADGYADAASDVVAAWVTPPATAALGDEAARWWAYAGVLTERAQQILADALTGSGDGASSSFSTDQAKTLLAQAAGWLAKYEGALVAAIPGGTAASRPVGSRVVPITVVW